MVDRQWDRRLPYWYHGSQNTIGPNTMEEYKGLEMSHYKRLLSPRHMESRISCHFSRLFMSLPGISYNVHTMFDVVMYQKNAVWFTSSESPKALNTRDPSRAYWQVILSSQQLHFAKIYFVENTLYHHNSSSYLIWLHVLGRYTAVHGSIKAPRPPLSPLSFLILTTLCANHNPCLILRNPIRTCCYSLSLTKYLRSFDWPSLEGMCQQIRDHETSARYCVVCEVRRI